MSEHAKHDQILREYELLRDENLQADRLVLQMMTIVFSVTGIIIVQGLSKNPHIFLVPFPILWVASCYVADKRWVGILTSSYLRFLESDDMQLRWQSRILAARKSGLRTGLNVFQVEFATFIVLGALCAIFFFLALLDPTTSISWWHGIAPVLLFLGLTISCWNNFRRLWRKRRADSLHTMWHSVSTHD